MRAAVIGEPGGQPYIAEVERPSPGPGQSLIRVAAAALNPLDLDFASGRHGVRPARFPYIPGFEGVGTVVESDNLEAGRRVRFECRPTFAEKGGSIAEFAVIASAWTFPVPDSVSDAVAAALGQAGITVWSALKWRAQLRTGESVLILGATGATGQLAVQAAKLLGAGRVVAAGRDDGALQRIRAMGADAIVDLKPERTAEALALAFRDASGGAPDVVLDALWGMPVLAAMMAADKNSRIVNYGSASSPAQELASSLIRFKGLTVLGHNSMLPPLEIIAETYRDLVENAATNALHIEHEDFELDRVNEAWTRQRSSPHRKLVLLTS